MGMHWARRDRRRSDHPRRSRRDGILLRGRLVAGTFALGEIVANPEPTDLSGPEVAQLDVYDRMEQTSRLMMCRPSEDNFDGP
jgi:hypothetical protein